MNDEDRPKAARQVLAKTEHSVRPVPDSSQAIGKALHFRPCRHRAPSEFLRMRRPRAEYEAAGRLLRSLYGARAGVVRCRAIGPYSVEFTGATGTVLEAVRALGVRWMRNKAGDGVLVPEGDAEDVMAFVEGMLGQRVEVTL